MKFIYLFLALHSTVFAADEIILQSIGDSRDPAHLVVFKYSRELLAKVPLWSPGTELKVGVEKIAEVSIDHINKISPGGITEWRIREFRFINADGFSGFGRRLKSPGLWLYIVSFEPAIEQEYNNFQGSADFWQSDVIILLDGTLVKPVRVRRDEPTGQP